MHQFTETATFIANPMKKSSYRWDFFSRFANRTAVTFTTKNILSVLEIQNVSLHFTFNSHKIKTSKQCASATEVLFGYVWQRNWAQPYFYSKFGNELIRVIIIIIILFQKSTHVYILFQSEIKGKRWLLTFF